MFQDPAAISCVHRPHVVEFCQSQAPRQPNTLSQSHAPRQPNTLSQSQAPRQPNTLSQSQAPRQPNTLNVRNLIQAPQSYIEHVSPDFKQLSNIPTGQGLIGRYQEPKEAQFCKNIITTVPSPPPDFSNSMRNGAGVIVQRAAPQYNYESPRCASPRFVIKPYRNTQVIAGNLSATSRDDLVKKEKMTANILSVFNKSKFVS